jgi:hypothetical protein
MVEHLGTREIAVKGEVARDTAHDGIVDQFHTQLGVILALVLGARIFFPEPSPFNGLVRSRGTDVVGDQVIMGDDIAFVGVVPAPAYVFDQLPCVVYQRIRVVP